MQSINEFFFNLYFFEKKFFFKKRYINYINFIFKFKSFSKSFFNDFDVKIILSDLFLQIIIFNFIQIFLNNEKLSGNLIHCASWNKFIILKFNLNSGA